MMVRSLTLNHCRSWVVIFLLLYGNLIGFCDAGLSFDSDLCVAVTQGNKIKVELELKKNVGDVDDLCLSTKTPLEEAAVKGFLAIGKLLLASGADVNRTNWLGYTPLLRATEHFQVAFMRLLLNNEADMYKRLVPIGDYSGIDVLTLATATYLGTFPFMSETEQEQEQRTYYLVLNILHEFCFDFENYDGASLTRLKSENHMAEAEYLERKEVPARRC